MLQAVKTSLLLYADDSCLFSQHKDVEEIKKALNNDFENICVWFIDIKPSILSGEDKTRSMVFAGQCKISTRK